jgi:plastocyanin
MSGPALLATALLLSSCSGGSTDTGSVRATGSADAQQVTLEMRDDLKFHPTTIQARVGTVTLRLDNTGQIPHDFAFQQRSLGKTGSIDGKSSQDLSVTFDKAGSYAFVCTIHPHMAGKVVVA